MLLAFVFDAPVMRTRRAAKRAYLSCRAISSSAPACCVIIRLHALAHAHGCLAADVALAWIIHSGSVIAIPESGLAAHVQENAVALSLTLTPQELQTLDTVSTHRQPPNTKGLFESKANQSGNDRACEPCVPKTLKGRIMPVVICKTTDNRNACLRSEAM
jgi:hypothetical protein